MIWKRQNSVRNNFICRKRYKAPPVLEKCSNFAADFWNMLSAAFVHWHIEPAVYIIHFRNFFGFFGIK